MTGFDRQRGHIVLTVSLVGLVTMMIAGAFYGSTLVTESRAVNESLAESRAYWAAMGTATYSLSRLHAAGGCGCDYETGTCSSLAPPCNSDLDRSATLATILGEIKSKSRWSYATSGNGYYIDISPAGDIDDGESSATNYGHLKLTLSFPTKNASTHPGLEGFAARQNPIELRFCIGLNVDTQPCQSGAGAIPNNLSGLPRIKSLRRPQG